MADLIDRQKIKARFEPWLKVKGYSEGEINMLKAVLYEITIMPSAERHGHWIIKDNPGTGWYRVTCSQCGEDVTSVAPVIGFFPKAKVIWDFCPECGARMDGEQDG